MALLPAGFTVPPWPYLVVLALAVGGVGYGLASRRPAVTARHVLGLAPWIVVGSALHVLYVVESLPAVIAPLAGTGAVYVTVAAIAGGGWLLADAVRPRTVPALLAASGLAVAVPLVGTTIIVGFTQNTLAPVWPAAGAGMAVLLTAAGWATLRRRRPTATTATGWVGLLAVFGHTLDAVSTTVGVDVLGFGERTPLSRVILDAAAALPTADIIGTGWLFILVKIGVVSAVVVLFAEYVAEEPSEGYPLLGVIAAVGLGPGTYNLLLFAITAG
jgi:Predicted membrane protein